jgi:hypothetical protein
MPIIAFDIGSDLFIEVMNLIKKGAYSSPEQFLELAVRNQLVYERAGNRARTPVDSASRSRIGEANSTPALEPAPWSTRFLLRTSGALPETQPIASGEHRIWGQINRLVPIKLVTRFLHVRGSSKQTWPSMEEVEQPLGDAVAELGSVLEEFDRRSDRRRDALLSTGLPRRGNEPSLTRFITQFVARVTREGKVYPGAVCQYPLAAVDGDQRLALTTLGVALATLPNPLIDGPIEEADTTLSDDERTFFIRQVVPHVPTEHADMRATVAAVNRGAISPQTLAAELILAVRRDPGTQAWSDVMMRTYVSGVVSRMVDLGILRRRWEGRRVTYEPGPLADQLVETRFAAAP